MPATARQKRPKTIAPFWRDAGPPKWSGKDPEMRAFRDLPFAHSEHATGAEKSLLAEGGFAG